MGAGGKLNVNKGAACASLRMPGLGRMGFVGAHFTAGQSSESASEARCQDFHHVLSTLRPTGAPADGGAGTGVPDNFAQVEVLFFTGDLNSRLRVRSDAEAIVEAFKRVDTARHADLLRQDELHYWRNNGLAFDPRDGWEEANIGFPPSYKLIADSAGHSSLEGEAYVYERSALPAWCDRVLWRARGHCVEAREYSSRYSTGSTCGSSSPTAAPAPTPISPTRLPFPDPGVWAASPFRPLRSYCSDHAPVWASFDISPGKPISKLSAAANAGPYDAEVMDAEGLWRAGRIVDRRGAAGGTYELLIARGPPAAPPHFQLWRNVLDRGQRWRQLEQPATLEVYSVSARAWCPGARASRADRQLGEGQFVARFRMPDGASWAEKILESADQEKTWRFLVAPQ
ncbi:unnamed protein product [Prorocentrum cordatum]|uniref:Inositol polyphosphate-related phosphatase domain-containing protein n=2 Tax=Prorocentrum cordatum TaxID=2364126 RepID=A0ABN9VF28_9DINO|nr:unnamed protein product [Polarella glacialis]